MKNDERWREHKYKLRPPKSGHRHWVLKYARKRKSGKYGKYERWPLQLTTPPWIFKWLLKRVKDLLQHIPSKAKTYHKELPHITQCLIDNGKAQRFKAKATDEDYGDVTWYCHDMPFITFMIADMSEHKQLWGQASDVAQKLRADKGGEGDRFRTMELKSKAPVRLVWAVSLHGRWFRLGIGEMRRKES